MTAAEVRAKYPNPVTAQPKTNFNWDGHYCVLGAALKMIDVAYPGDDRDFPEYLPASMALGIGRGMALRITLANDREDFELAWELLDQALKGIK